MKHVVIEMSNAVNGLNSRVLMAPDRISEIQNWANYTECSTQRER